MLHGRMPRRLPIALVAVLLLVLGTTAVAGGKPRAKAGPRADPPPAAGSGHVATSVELRLGAGVTYSIRSTSNQCADNLNLPADTTKSATETVWIGFDPSNEVDDGCFTRASWSNYIVYVSGPYGGQIEFSFGAGTNGGAYRAKCSRNDSEYGVWCHATSGTSLVIGKLN
jgi:hypothetical protein